MSENGSTEESVAGISSRKVEEGPEIQKLTQETVIKQTKGFITPLTRQLEELTPLVQSMATTPHPRTYPRVIAVPLLVQPQTSPTITVYLFTVSLRLLSVKETLVFAFPPARFPHVFCLPSMWQKSGYGNFEFFTLNESSLFSKFVLPTFCLKVSITQ